MLRWFLVLVFVAVLCLFGAVWWLVSSTRLVVCVPAEYVGGYISIDSDDYLIENEVRMFFLSLGFHDLEIRKVGMPTLSTRIDLDSRVEAYYYVLEDDSGYVLIDEEDW